MKATIVIVLYKVQINQSTTLKTLMEVLMNRQQIIGDKQIIIYDNGPDNQQDLISEKWKELIQITYINDPRNLGISEAYNYAYGISKKENSDWILLLDHDTAITNEYIEEIFGLQKIDSNIAAVVPKIVSEQIMISPVFSENIRPLKGEKPSEGLQQRSVMAINSGALIRVSFLDEIGGFNNNFKLDYLDHWLFYEIFVKGYTVQVLRSILEHELSVLDYSRISLPRYKSIIDSEHLFYKKYKKDLYQAYKKQLVKRLIKQAVFVKNKKIALYTMKRLFS